MSFAGKSATINSRMSKARKNIKVLQYNAVFEQGKDGGYSVWVPALPGCCSQGDNFEEAVNNIKEAMGLYLEDKMEAAKELDEAKSKQFLVPITISYAY